ncbi:MAG: glucose-1-phosphate adenylyltransferase [Clostridia bacterium]
MRKKRIVAMLLAGGQGSRLSVLTHSMAKPAVPFGGKYRIIDFPLSNCVNSDIDTVGVLTQYEPLELNAYIGTGQTWDLDRNSGGVYVLPPYVRGSHGEWYSGTANAIYQNIPFVDRFNPDNVLILSGDHIYKMDYAKMLKYHIEKDADATIAVLRVPMDEAHRFGIMDTDGQNRIVEFEEKPANPKSDKASMGIYIFKWKLLKEFLAADEDDKSSDNDFGKNVIPAMLGAGRAVYAYSFSGYWKDVGTVQSLWEANMDIIGDTPKLNLNEREWRIYGKNPIMPPHCIGEHAQVTDCAVAEGSDVAGKVSHSVVFTGVTIEEGAEVSDCVILPDALIKRGARVHKAIVGESAVVGENASIGDPRTPEDGDYDISLTGDITLIANAMTIADGERIPVGRIVGILGEGGGT